LFNALAGYKAVTSNYPGTTVEAMEARTSLDGEKVRLVDTPGIYSMSDATILPVSRRRSISRSSCWRLRFLW
jgi:ferrous iron transport protein B